MHHTGHHALVELLDYSCEHFWTAIFLHDVPKSASISLSFVEVVDASGVYNVSE